MGAEFAAEIRRLMQPFDTPGLAVEMLAQGTLHKSHGGRLASDRRHPVTEKTRFGTVCLIKALIAIKILQMAEAGEIGLGAPVADYLPELGKGANAKGRFLKLHHLLSHTGGFRSYTVQRLLPKAHESWDNCVRLLHDTDQHFEPGTVFDDEHLSHIILGQLIERLKQKPFLDVICQEVLSPLGITPGNRTQDAQHPDIYAHRHARNGPAQRWQPEADSYVTPDPAFGAISHLSMTSGDLMRLGRALLPDETPGAACRLSAWVRKQLFCDMVQVPRTFSPMRSMRWSVAGFGLGMARFQSGHRGTVTTGRGQNSAIIFDRERHALVALAMNAPDVPAREALLDGLFAAFTGDKPAAAPATLDIGFDEFLGPFTTRDIGGLYFGFRPEPVEIQAGPRSLVLRIDREEHYAIEATPDDRLVMRTRLPMPIGLFQDPVTHKPCLMMGVNAFKKVV